MMTDVNSPLLLLALALVAALIIGSIARYVLANKAMWANEIKPKDHDLESHTIEQLTEMRIVKISRRFALWTMCMIIASVTVLTAGYIYKIEFLSAFGIFLLLIGGRMGLTSLSNPEQFDIPLLEGQPPGAN